MIVAQELLINCHLEDGRNRRRVESDHETPNTHATEVENKKAEEVNWECRIANDYRGTFRSEVWLFLKHMQPDPRLSWFSNVYEMFSVILVLYLVAMDIVLSIPSLEVIKDSQTVAVIEFCIYAVFTTEYLLLLWSCMANETLNELGPCRGRLKLASELMNIVDFLVCSAYYITFLPGSKFLSGMGALRMIRLLRVGALMKLEKRTSSISKIGKVCSIKQKELLSTAFMASVLMILSAAVMFYIEVDAQPVAFGSIPASLWWSVTALTTVGYGDVAPVTPMGKLTASLFAFFGVGIFALPAGILGEGFMEVMQEEHNNEVIEMRTEIGNDMREQVKRAYEVHENVEDLIKVAARVQERQTQIFKLLKVLAPELAELNQLNLENNAPMSPATPLDVCELAHAVSKNKEILSDIHTNELASLQEHFERRLSGLRVHNGQHSPVQRCA